MSHALTRGGVAAFAYEREMMPGTTEAGFCPSSVLADRNATSTGFSETEISLLDLGAKGYDCIHTSMLALPTVVDGYREAYKINRRWDGRQQGRGFWRMYLARWLLSSIAGRTAVGGGIHD